jgi:two-component system, NtrC family, response regulator AtoC
VRLIAATNKNLEQMVQEGKFREDLFYRLNVVPIQMPPLRDRREDIPALANAFLKEFASKNKKTLVEIEPGAMEILVAYPWKGNVRELRAAIEGAVVLGRRDRIGVRELPASVRNFNPSSGESAGPSTRSNMTVEQAEKQLIFDALKSADGNRTEAAKRLGISRRTLHRKLHAYHLEGF